MLQGITVAIITRCTSCYDLSCTGRYLAARFRSVMLSLDSGTKSYRMVGIFLEVQIFVDFVRSAYPRKLLNFSYITK